jgi:hypothetical protein
LDEYSPPKKEQRLIEMGGPLRTYDTQTVGVIIHFITTCWCGACYGGLVIYGPYPRPNQALRIFLWDFLSVFLEPDAHLSEFPVSPSCYDFLNPGQASLPLSSPLHPPFLSRLPIPSAIVACITIHAGHSPIKVTSTKPCSVIRMPPHVHFCPRIVQMHHHSIGGTDLSEGETSGPMDVEIKSRTQNGGEKGLWLYS